MRDFIEASRTGKGFMFNDRLVYFVTYEQKEELAATEALYLDLKSSIKEYSELIIPNFYDSFESYLGEKNLKLKKEINGGEEDNSLRGRVMDMFDLRTIQMELNIASSLNRDDRNNEIIFPPKEELKKDIESMGIDIDYTKRILAGVNARFQYIRVEIAKYGHYKLTYQGPDNEIIEFNIFSKKSPTKN